MGVQNATSSRLVIYYNNSTTLSVQQIAALPCTDVILAFLVPSGPSTSPSDLVLQGQGAWNSPSELGANVQTLKTAGKNVLISFGGALGVSSGQYQAYSENVGDLVSDLVGNWVVTYDLSGVDIDFEDSSAFTSTGSYNGVDFLTSLTNQLAQQLPPGQNIITHAPQTPYWGTTLFDEPYVKIWQKVSGAITWINNQFYNNAGWDGTPALDVQWYETIAKTTGPQNVMLGMPVATSSAGEGYIPLHVLIAEVIQPLQQEFPTDFGGVMGWELSDDTGGAWESAIGSVLG